MNDLNLSLSSCLIDPLVVFCNEENSSSPSGTTKQKRTYGFYAKLVCTEIGFGLIATIALIESVVYSILSFAATCISKKYSNILFNSACRSADVYNCTTDNLFANLSMERPLKYQPLAQEKIEGEKQIQKQPQAQIEKNEEKMKQLQAQIQKNEEKMKIIMQEKEEKKKILQELWLKKENLKLEAKETENRISIFIEQINGKKSEEKRLKSEENRLESGLEEQKIIMQSNLSQIFEILSKKFALKIKITMQTSQQNFHEGLKLQELDRNKLRNERAIRGFNEGLKLIHQILTDGENVNLRKDLQREMSPKALMLLSLLATINCILTHQSKLDFLCEEAEALITPLQHNQEFKVKLQSFIHVYKQIAELSNFINFEIEQIKTEDEKEVCRTIMGISLTALQGSSLFREVLGAYKELPDEVMAF